MRIKLNWTLAATLIGLTTGVFKDAEAVVVVIANRTAAPVRFESMLVIEAGPRQQMNNDAVTKATAIATETLPSSRDGTDSGNTGADASRRADDTQSDPPRIRHQVQPEQVTVVNLFDADAVDIQIDDFVPYRLKPWGVYYLGQKDQDRVELHEIGLGADLSKIVDLPSSATPSGRQPLSRNQPHNSNGPAAPEMRPNVKVASPPDKSSQVIRPQSLAVGPPTSVKQAGRKQTADRLANVAQSGTHSTADTQFAETQRAELSSRTIKVAIFVDDDEKARQQVWEPRLKKRLEKASDILYQHCGLRFEVDEVSQWQSNDAIDDFELSLREFERKAKPQRARIAIGFTSQYQLTEGRTHLGGTRGPLAGHILLREWSNHVSESERLELLIHELSHFLGAAHSPETRSVMRSLLGDKQARERDFVIGIDPVNTLAMNIVAEEIRVAGVDSFAQLGPAASARLAIIYSALRETLPQDPAAEQMLRILPRHSVAPANSLPP